MATNNRPVFSEHLPPQDRLQTLGGKTQSNYNIAMNHYKQRREMLQSLLQTNVEEGRDVFKELTLKAINTWWQQAVETHIKSIAQFDKNNIGKEWSLPQIENKALKLPQDVEDALYQAYCSNNWNNFAANIGKAYESWLPQKVLGPILQEVLPMLQNNGITEVLQVLNTGERESLSSMTTKKTWTRSDGIIGFDVTLIDDNGILKHKASDLPIELQGDLIASTPEMLNTDPMQEKKRDEILKKYLTATGAESVFGYQVKRFQSLEKYDQKWSTSAVMADKLNQIYNQVDSHGFRHGWEKYYIEPYLVYFLSRYLMDIINPINVALITGANFYWIDQMLENHIFYMKVAGTQRVKGRNTQNTGYGAKSLWFPQIDNTKIYISKKQDNLDMAKIATNNPKHKRTVNFSIRFRK